MEGILKALLCILILLLGFSLGKGGENTETTRLTGALQLFSSGDSGGFRESPHVYGSETVFDSLASLFAAADSEYKLCLHGQVEGDIFITGFSLAPVYHADGTTIVSEVCKGALGELHNHRAGDCSLSATDKETLRRLLEDGSLGEGSLEVVQCGPESFAVYVLPDLESAQVLVQDTRFRISTKEEKP